MTSIPEIPAMLPPFEYTAQTYDGRPVSGTIDAADLDDASRRLSDLRLRIIRLDLAQRPIRSKPLSDEDFALFNQQLAHLAAAGLPIEQGLRLIAEDLQVGGLAQSIRDVAGEMERGVPLADAFQRHEKQFPSLYSTLIDAGVRTGNLSGVLLNLGRHMELVNRLRAAIWRSAAYPLTVIVGLLCILLFLGHFVLPEFEQIYRAFEAASLTLANLQSSAQAQIPNDPETRVSIQRSGKRIGNLEWIEVTTVRASRRATIAGLARATTAPGAMP